MRILLDTHIFLWFISGDTRLSNDVRDAIRDPSNEVYLGAVSIWEAIVKHHWVNYLCRNIPERIYLSNGIFIKLPVLLLTKVVWFNWLIYRHYIVTRLTEC